MTTVNKPGHTCDLTAPLSGVFCHPKFEGIDGGVGEDYLHTLR